MRGPIERAVLRSETIRPISPRCHKRRDSVPFGSLFQGIVGGTRGSSVSGMQATFNIVFGRSSVKTSFRQETAWAWTRRRHRISGAPITYSNHGNLLLERRRPLSIAPVAEVGRQPRNVRQRKPSVAVKVRTLVVRVRRVVRRQKAYIGEVDQPVAVLSRAMNPDVEAKLPACSRRSDQNNAHHDCRRSRRS